MELWGNKRIVVSLLLVLLFCLLNILLLCSIHKLFKNLNWNLRWFTNFVNLMSQLSFFFFLKSKYPICSFKGFTNWIKSKYINIHMYTWNSIRSINIISHFVFLKKKLLHNYTLFSYNLMVHRSRFEIIIWPKTNSNAVLKTTFYVLNKTNIYSLQTDQNVHSSKRKSFILHYLQHFF